MNFSEKARILGLFYYNYQNQAGWDAFIRINDVGLPLAWLISLGCADATEKGIEYVEETWEKFCLFVGVPPEGTYGSLDSIMLKASKVEHV